MSKEAGSSRYVFEMQTRDRYRVHFPLLPGISIYGNSLKEASDNLEKWDKNFQNKLDFILSNLIEEDKTLFLKELGEEYLKLLKGEIQEIPITFWDEWEDTAEFESDKEALKVIDEMEKAYREEPADEGLSMEELWEVINSKESNPA